MTRAIIEAPILILNDALPPLLQKALYDPICLANTRQIGAVHRPRICAVGRLTSEENAAIDRLCHSIVIFCFGAHRHERLRAETIRVRTPSRLHTNLRIGNRISKDFS